MFNIFNNTKRKVENEIKNQFDELTDLQNAIMDLQYDIDDNVMRIIQLQTSNEVSSEITVETQIEILQFENEDIYFDIVMTRIEVLDLNEEIEINFNLI